MTTTRWDTLTVDGSPMRCYVALPDLLGPIPAVVVCQHAGGVDDFIQRMTRCFAERGYAAIAPDLYHREDPNSGDDAMTRMGRLQDPQIIRDVSAAVAHVRGLDAVQGERIGITGFCMGGRVTLLMAGSTPDAFRAAVDFYGGNIFTPWGDGPAPFTLLDRIACPVLGLFGENDPNPSPADVEKQDDELTRLGKTYEFYTYPGAGHAFMSEGRPSYREGAAIDAWQKCTAWFERYLAS